MNAFAPVRPDRRSLGMALAALAVGAALAAATPLRAAEQAMAAWPPALAAEAAGGESATGAAPPNAAELAAATAVAPDDRILYPRNAVERSAAAVEPRPSRGPNYLGLLAFGGLCAAGGVWLLKRGGLRTRIHGADTRRLQIEETRPLGNRQFLAVAAYGQRRLLLAVCPGRIDLLCPLDEPAAPAAPAPAPSTIAAHPREPDRSF